MAWNPGSASRGMSAHHPLETALTIPWNTQRDGVSPVTPDGGSPALT
jgi:hypothetical protein